MKELLLVFERKQQRCHCCLFQKQLLECFYISGVSVSVNTGTCQVQSIDWQSKSSMEELWLPQTRVAFGGNKTRVVELPLIGFTLISAKCCALCFPACELQVFEL